jgi:hypothetical protein
MQEPVRVSDIPTTMIYAVDLGKWRAHAVEGVQEAQLTEDAKAHRQKYKISTCVQDDFGTLLQQDKINASASEGMSSRQSDRTSADNNRLEACL